MTYNIQQGFDKVGNTALPGQLAAIRRVQPDVLGVEESDTAGHEREHRHGALLRG